MNSIFLANGEYKCDVKENFTNTNLTMASLATNLAKMAVANSAAYNKRVTSGSREGYCYNDWDWSKKKTKNDKETFKCGRQKYCPFGLDVEKSCSKVRTETVQDSRSRSNKKKLFTMNMTCSDANHCFCSKPYAACKKMWSNNSNYRTFDAYPAFNFWPMVKHYNSGYCKDGEWLETHQGKTFKECKLLCAANDDCNFISYTGKNDGIKDNKPGCALYSGDKCIATGKSSGCKNKYEACHTSYEKQKSEAFNIYSGSSDYENSLTEWEEIVGGPCQDATQISGTKNKTEGECKNACLNNNECNFYYHNKLDSSCKLYQGKYCNPSVRPCHTSYKKKFEMIPKGANKSGACQGGSNYISSINDKSLEDCKKACLDNNSCNYISYIKREDNKDGKTGCALYRNKCSASVASGACKKTCHTSYKKDGNTMKQIGSSKSGACQGGLNYIESKNNKTLSECKKACLDNNRCNYMSYIKSEDSKDGIGGCALYKDKCSASVASGACKKTCHTSYQKTPIEPVRYEMIGSENSGACQGGDNHISSLNNKSLEECKKACSGVKNCNHISYIKSEDSKDGIGGCALYKNKCSASEASGACGNYVYKKITHKNKGWGGNIKTYPK